MSLSKRERYLHMTLFIAEHFASKGHVVHYMQSTTTVSCYLKIDYGAGHSLRISDHPGKPGFGYRFNLYMDLPEPKSLSLSELELVLPPTRYSSYNYHDGQLTELLFHMNQNISSRTESDYASYKHYCQVRFAAQASHPLSFSNRSKRYVPGQFKGTSHSLESSKPTPRIFL